MSFGISLTSNNTGFVKAGSRQTFVNELTTINHAGGTVVYTVYTAPAGKTFYILGYNFSASNSTGTKEFDLVGDAAWMHTYLVGENNKTFISSIPFGKVTGGNTLSTAIVSAACTIYFSVWGWYE